MQISSFWSYNIDFHYTVKFTITVLSAPNWLLPYKGVRVRTGSTIDLRSDDDRISCTNCCVNNVVIPQSLHLRLRLSFRL